MVSFKSFLIFAAMASATLMQQRDDNLILTDLQKIDAAAKKMASDAKANQGTTAGLTILSNDLRALDDKVRSAAQDAGGQAPLTSADSKTVLTYLSNPLTPDFKAALDAFVARKSDYQKNGLTPLAKNDLTTLKQDVDSLGNVLVNLVSSDQKATAKNDMATLDGYLNSAIAAFS